MLFFLLLILHGLCIGCGSTLFGFNLYRTDRRLNSVDHDCLSYFPPKIKFAYQVIEYCIRSDFDDEVVDYMVHDQFTFEDLREKNITSDQLYNWSAPIDLIEQYQNYLEMNTSVNDTLFYNCSFPWFGSRCEYTFDEPTTYLSEQMRLVFIRKQATDERHLTIPSCYIHVQCDRTGDRSGLEGACLDWREVCDGKVDCINGGQDEEPCWVLETNDCDEETEFRCHNGLCIPLAFLWDDPMNADCLDRSDETLKIIDALWDMKYSFEFPKDCSDDPTIRCEDHMCHPSTYRNHMVECGDGSCAKLNNHCSNKRNTKLLDALWFGANISNDCRLNLICFTQLQTLEYLTTRCKFISSARVKNITEYCPVLIALPPILFGHVRFVFTNNQFQVIE